MKKLITLVILVLIMAACQEPINRNEITSLESTIIKNKSNIELTSHVYVNCQINDSIEGIFLFDTGANGLVLDRLFLERNNLADKIISTDSGFTYGVGADKTKHEGLSDIRLQIDGKVFVDLELRVMPLDSIFSKVLNHRIDGILGYDVFEDYILKLNFDKHTFELEDSLTIGEIDEYAKVEYVKNYRKPIVNTTLNDKTGATFTSELIFDMGSGRGISLTHAKGLSENLFTEKITCELDSIAGMGGVSESCYLPMEHLQLSGIEIEIDSIEVGKDNKGALGLHKMYDGMLGMRIIEKFNLILDAKNRHIWLKMR